MNAWHSQAHIKAKGSSVKPATFLAVHKLIYPLVMSKAAVEKVLTVSMDESWFTANRELQMLVRGSELGKRLFSTALQCTLSETLGTTISTCLKAFTAEGWSCRASPRRWSWR